MTDFYYEDGNPMFVYQPGRNLSGIFNMVQRDALTACLPVHFGLLAVTGRYLNGPSQIFGSEANMDFLSRGNTLKFTRQAQTQFSIKYKLTLPLFITFFPVYIHF